jgi:two-component system chemotaxis sensor kinase CheA
VEIADDGGGIDPARVRDAALAARVRTADGVARMSDAELVDLIFRPGFTTADRVTHLSGRGVGMDVVRANVERSAAPSRCPAGSAAAPRCGCASR